MNIQMLSKRLAPVACAAGLLLAGCGGGGGDDGPATAGFDAASYQTVAEPVASSVASSTSVAAALSGFTGQELPMAVGQAAAQPDPLGLLKRAVARSGNGLEQPQATESFSEDCPGGGRLRITAKDADNNGMLSRGDSASITAENCVIEGSTVNGTLGISVRQLGDTSATLALSFSSFSVDGTSISGAATVSVNVGTQTSLRLSYDDVAFNQAGTSLLLSYTATMTSATGGVGLHVEGGIRVNGHDYTLTQPADFFFASAGLQPDGVLQVRGDAGERVRVVRGTSGFTYQYFAPGNNGTTPDATRAGQAY